MEAKRTCVKLEQSCSLYNVAIDQVFITTNVTYTSQDWVGNDVGFEQGPDFLSHCFIILVRDSNNKYYWSINTPENAQILIQIPRYGATVEVFSVS